MRINILLFLLLGINYLSAQVIAPIEFTEANYFLKDSLSKSKSANIIWTDGQSIITYYEPICTKSNVYYATIENPNTQSIFYGFIKSTKLEYGYNGRDGLKIWGVTTSKENKEIPFYLYSIDSLTAINSIPFSEYYIDANYYANNDFIYNPPYFDRRILFAKNNQGEINTYNRMHSIAPQKPTSSRMLDPYGIRKINRLTGGYAYSIEGKKSQNISWKLRDNRLTITPITKPKITINASLDMKEITSNWHPADASTEEYRRLFLKQIKDDLATNDDVKESKKYVQSLLTECIQSPTEEQRYSVLGKCGNDIIMVKGGMGQRFNYKSYVILTTDESLEKASLTKKIDSFMKEFLKHRNINWDKYQNIYENFCFNIRNILDNDTTISQYFVSKVNIVENTAGLLCISQINNESMLLGIPLNYDENGTIDKNGFDNIMRFDKNPSLLTEIIKNHEQICSFETKEDFKQKIEVYKSIYKKFTPKLLRFYSFEESFSETKRLESMLKVQKEYLEIIDTQYPNERTK